MAKFIKFFNDLRIKDVPQVGGKNASLGEMYSRLKKDGVRVPDGFATTAQAYQYFLEAGGIKQEIKNILRGLNTQDVLALARAGQAVRSLIIKTPFPADLENEILVNYRKLGTEYKTKKTFRKYIFEFGKYFTISNFLKILSLCRIDFNTYETK